ncbi:hypothetical protein PN462_05200 [Spirulina sp. CS-785/01]|uniref:hypothetical protein n=1 Tax=Spirulina sp. CS-785/01 TaxID=3021716 RepID=UPI00232F7E99|nr:hypothetical protein [Spirulina sp. CS-785/01]MDB9312493.1 hypothetical protein [Spirulina sp. CS-785/01]
MSQDFQTITGGLYSFIENKSVRNAIDNAGRKKIVFVEGYDDHVIFNILFQEQSDRIAFVTDTNRESLGGCEQVKEYLRQIVENLTPTQRQKFFGIIDRDFRTDEEVEQELNNSIYDGRLYIFKSRYTLENYFIDSEIIYNYLYEKSADKSILKPIIASLKLDDIEYIINTFFQKYITIAAGNWTLLKQRKNFLKDNQICSEELVLKTIIQRSPEISEEEIKVIYDKCKEYIQNEMRNDINNRQKYVKGKYFFFYLNRKLKEKAKELSTKFNEIEFSKSHLARILKDKLPNELSRILEFINKKNTTS